METRTDKILCLILAVLFTILFVIPLCTSCSVLAISAGKAKNTISQTTTTTTTTTVDSTTINPLKLK